jgi:Ni/Fe-hydrogenase subunit HybB-like protein
LHYIPKWTEIAVTTAITAGGFALFSLAVKYLPIFPEEVSSPVSSSTEVVVPEPVLDNAGD